MKRFNLKYQILIITMIPVLLIDGFLSYVHVNSSIQQAEELLKAKGEVTTKQLADASEFNLLSGNFEHIQYLLKQTVNTNDIIHATVYDRQGNTIAEAQGQEFNPDSSTSYLYYRHPIQTQALPSDDIFATQDALDNDQLKNIGWVHLYVSRQRLEQSKNDVYREALLFFVITLIIAIILIMLFSSRITRPVFILLDHLKRIETGHLGEVIEQVENNEIGDVQKGFNSMSQSLLANRMQLDQKIKTATLDLMNAITDLEYKNREISLARDEAQKADKTKSQFLANISHEIRTPVNGIKGFANLLAQTELTPQQKRYTDIITNSTSDLSSIVNEVLDYSKIESEKVEILNDRFDLYELVESTRDSLFTVAMEKEIELYLTIYSDTPQFVVGDQLRLKQILINLVSNAIKFTDEGYVEITVHVEDESDDQVMMKFKIRDSGIGISKEDQKQLFQAFKQIEKDSNRRFSGTGLGLVISRNLATLMGGDILLDSVTNFGSMFTLMLPFKPCHQAPSSSRLADNCDYHVLLLSYEQRGLNEITALYDRAGCETERLLLSKDQDATEVQNLVQRAINHVDIIVFDLRHAHLLPAQIFDSTIRKSARVIIMHYDQTLVAENELANFEFIAVINTSANLLRLLKQQPQTDEANTMSSNKALNKSSVLIVDDNPINLALASELIQLWGHHPFEASNAEQAMNLFRVKSFDLILLDIQMPEIDGVELMKMMRNEAPDLKSPIVAITANILESERNRLLSLGFDAYFSKPIEEQKLKAMLVDGELPDQDDDTLIRLGEETLSIDHDLTLKLSANNQRLASEVFTMLQKELPDYLQQLHHSLESQSLEDIEKIMHKLEGVTCYAGLPRLKQLLREYEDLKLKDLEQVPQVGRKVIEELENIEQALAA